MLKNLWREGGCDIFLSDGEPFELGRNQKSGIADRNVAKNHVEIVYHQTDKTATVKKVGTSNCAINGQTLVKGKPLEIKPGDKIDILDGKIVYKFLISAQKTEISKNSDSKTNLGSRKEKGAWQETEELLIYSTPGVEPRSKVAAFDVDGTIITTKSEKVFPKDESDWKFLCSEIPGRLKELYRDGYKIVFMTNQKGIKLGKQPKEPFKRKIETICQTIGSCPIQVFISTGSRNYRKPYIGMWSDALEKRNNDGVAIDKAQSMYVGDAAGRPASKTRKKKDFSCSDRLFASNLSISFKTPEEFFLGQKPEPFTLPAFDPKSLFDSDRTLFEPSTASLAPKGQELAILVGWPGSGKSHFVHKHLKPNGYEVISRDQLKTWQKCVEAAKNHIAAGKSVVIDNTNPDVESRKRYLDLAKQANINCRCFLMTADRDQVKHHVAYRELAGPIDKAHENINDMVLNMFKSKYNEPVKSEGFQEIVRVNFVPDFENEEQKRLFQMRLVEK